MDALALAQLCRGDISKLPPLVVHTAGWKGEPQVDSKGRIHMSEATLAAMRHDVPVRFVSRLGEGVDLYLFDLEPHHIQAGKILEGKRPHDQQALRDVVNRSRDH